MTGMDRLHGTYGRRPGSEGLAPVPDSQARSETGPAVAVLPDAVLPALPPVGEVVACMANSPIEGTEPGRAWIVLRGTVDLFGVRRTVGAQDGHRHPLFRAGQGEVILGVPALTDSGGARLVLSGDLNALVYETALDSLLADPSGPWIAAVGQWVCALSAALFDEPNPWPAAVAGNAGAVRLRARETVFGASHSVLWAERQTGHMRWRAREDFDVQLEDEVLLPLTAGLSVIADGTGEIVVATTADLARQGRLMPALAHLHGLAAERLGAWVVGRETRDRVRLIERQDRDQRIWEATLARATDLLSGRRTEAASGPETVCPPLEDIFLRVAAAQGWLGGELHQGRSVRPVLEDQIHALARAAGMRARCVLLRGAWWWSESGPLIAFEGENRDPVALLPQDPSAYRLIRPGGEDGGVIDETLAETLSGDAFSLYVPLPESGRRMRDLLGMAVKAARWDLLRVLVMGLGAALLALVTPVVTGFLIDDVIPRAETHRVAEAAVALVGIALGAGAFRAVQAIGLVRLEGTIDRVGQAALFQRLLLLPTRFFRGYTVGDLADRCLGFQHIRRILTGNTLQASVQGIFSMVSLGLLFVYDWKLALIACVALGLSCVWLGAVTLAQRKARSDMARWQGRIDGLTVQMLSAIGKLRVAGAEDRAFARWFAQVIRQKACLKRAQRWANLGETLTAIIPIICTGALFVGLSMLMDDREWEVQVQGLLPVLDLADTDGPLNLFTAGDFMAFNAAFGQAMAGLLLLARFLPELVEIGPYLDRLRPILEAGPESGRGGINPGPLSGAVSLNHVTFRYEAGSAPVIDDLSLDIESGSFVALVGPSGGGKSTVVRLLMGFETPETGTVFHGGLPLDQMDLTALRAQVGVVLQDGRVNQGSIAENIIGTSGASLEDAWTAARMAGLAGDIEAMPMGMHTVLVEGAQTLSGGQRQRLLLARALVGRPRLVILDEATSALDNRTQEVVTTSLERLHCTRIVIAHRLSTIIKADRIVVIDGGRIVESGPYETLMISDGPFQALARRQLM